VFNPQSQGLGSIIALKVEVSYSQLGTEQRKHSQWRRMFQTLTGASEPTQTLSGKPAKCRVGATAGNTPIEQIVASRRGLRHDRIVFHLVISSFL